MEYVYQCPVDGNARCVRHNPAQEIKPMNTFHVKCDNCGKLHPCYGVGPMPWEKEPVPRKERLAGGMLTYMLP